MIYLLNSPVLTSFGKFTYHPITIEQIKNMLKEEIFKSAIGHESTAQLLTKLLDIKVDYNRIAIHQQDEDILIVIKLNIRAEANKEYSTNEIIEAGFETGILIKNSNYEI